MMDSSENDQEMEPETPEPPPEHVEHDPRAGMPTDDRQPIAEEHLVRGQPQVPNEGVEPAEPGVYYCETEDPGTHPKLGALHQGENDFSDVTDPEVLQALGEAVAGGLLRKA